MSCITIQTSISMASNGGTDVWGWITSLPPFPQWPRNTTSLSLFTSSSSSSSSKSSLKVSLTKNLQNPNPNLIFSILADVHIPIPLWTSTPFLLKSTSQPSFDQETLTLLFHNVINGVLHYGPQNYSSFRLPAVQTGNNFREIFNLSFKTLAFLVCLYEAPQELRMQGLEALKLELMDSRSREASKTLVRVLGSNLEEQWMRSFSLAITNWMVERQASNQSFKALSPLFSYAFSATGLWKVQLYCPLMAMNLVDDAAATQDENLLFSLKYQQLEGVIQLAYKVIIKENWIDVVVRVDNIRCDVIPLVSETLMAERGHGSAEKHFPSRVSLQLTPTLQTHVISVSASKSTDNPAHEVGLEKGIEGSFDPPGPYLGLKVSATESITMSMKPWKFEQSVNGNTASLHWFLHDGVNGKEVFSSRPSKVALLHPKAWFRDRYSTAYRPFTKQGGVIFAGDEYGESVWWKVEGGALGKTMEWEIKGWIWLTYWPNKVRTFYTETRRLKFKELLYLPLTRM